MDITHDNVCSSMLSCFYSHLLSTGRPISSCMQHLHKYQVKQAVLILKGYSLKSRVLSTKIACVTAFIVSH